MNAGLLLDRKICSPLCVYYFYFLPCCTMLYMPLKQFYFYPDGGKILFSNRGGALGGGGGGKYNFLRKTKTPIYCIVNARYPVPVPSNIHLVMGSCVFSVSLTRCSLSGWCWRWWAARSCPSTGFSTSFRTTRIQTLAGQTLIPSYHIMCDFLTWSFWHVSFSEKKRWVGVI